MLAFKLHFKPFKFFVFPRINCPALLITRKSLRTNANAFTYLRNQKANAMDPTLGEEGFHSPRGQGHLATNIVVPGLQ